MRVVVATLQLKPRFEDLGRDVDDGGGKIANKAWDMLAID